MVNGDAATTTSLFELFRFIIRLPWVAIGENRTCLDIELYIFGTGISDHFLKLLRDTFIKKVALLHKLFFLIFRFIHTSPSFNSYFTTVLNNLNFFKVNTSYITVPSEVPVS